MTKTILIVDDERDIVSLLDRIFKRKDYNVYTAYNGKEALDIVSGNHQSIDCIITDTNMPVMNGHELMKNCRDLGYNKTIIQMHGAGTDGKSEHADYFAPKPFDYQKLIDFIEAEK